MAISNSIASDVDSLLGATTIGPTLVGVLSGDEGSLKFQDPRTHIRHHTGDDGA
jgi:hypothetical protein